jgi:hypothetical protein
MGIIEEIKAQLDRIEARLGGQPAPVTAAPAVLATPAPATALAAPVAPLAAPTALAPAPVAATPTPAPVTPPGAVTGDMITAVVTGMVDRPGARQLLMNELAAMGLTQFPEAQPHQYADLYQRCLNVKAHLDATPAAAAPGAAPGII